MHEMALAGGVLQLVEDTAARQPFARVQRLTLSVGALAGVEVRALRFALEALGPGTRLEGAQIVIVEPAAQAWCLPCSRSAPIASRTDPCPHCGGHQLQPTSGAELQLVDLMVLD